MSTWCVRARVRAVVILTAVAAGPLAAPANGHESASATGTKASKRCRAAVMLGSPRADCRADGSADAAPGPAPGTGLLGNALPLVNSITAPNAVIDAGPPRDSIEPRATVTFHAVGAASGFECSLDGESYEPCVSPAKFVVGASDHDLLVRAYGPGGADATPAQVHWNVGVQAPTGRTPFAFAASNPLTRTSIPGIQLGDQIMFVTLMNVRDKLANPINGASWYLWTWTHDTHFMHLFTAPRATGPFTEVLADDGGPLVPAGGPPRSDDPACSDRSTAPDYCYDPNHWSSGDVVWDPKTQYFYSTPHSMQWRYFGKQLTFIMRSRDGKRWQLINQSRPILAIGAAGSFDDYEIAYGRFLRDIDGNLVRDVDGKALWYYRGTQRPADCGESCDAFVSRDVQGTHVGDDMNNPSTKDKERYQLGAATSSDLAHWTKVSDGPIDNPFSEGIFGLGSAIAQDGAVTLTWSNGDTMFQKTSRDPVVWANGPVTTQRQSTPFLQPVDRQGAPAVTTGPGTPMYHHLPAQIDGGNVVRDGNVLRMAFGVWYGSHYESNLASSYPRAAGAAVG